MRLPRSRQGRALAGLLTKWYRPIGVVERRGGQVALIGLVPKMMRVAVLTLLAIACTSTASRADTGIVTAVISKGALIVGVGAGRGTLVFHDHTYHLVISGMSFGASIGVSTAKLKGHAYNIQTPADIEGAYSAIGAGVAVAAGAGSVRLRNARGVILELSGMRVGVEFSLASSGVRIRLR
jgi:hypothetical protein